MNNDFDKFDKWFFIAVVSLIIIFFIAWAIWLGYSFNELVEAQKELL